MADWLVSPGISTVAMESTGVYWNPMYEILEDRGLEVVLANARECKAVSGRKSDVNDAQWLQRLHASGLVRGSFRPVPQQTDRSGLAPYPEVPRPACAGAVPACRRRSHPARPTRPAMIQPKIPRPAADDSTPLEQALEQSRDAKEKVEDVAEELASTNRTVRRRIATGATMVPARMALQKGLDVEAKAHDAADDLEGVTDALAQGVEDLRQVEATLALARKDLALTEAALDAARVEERAATHRAFHDAATGLPNRSLFDDRVAHGILMAERHGWTLAMMFFDLNGFKRVNDTHGHAAGDAVLKAVATRLEQSARDEDTVCRNGGDEFLYLLVDPKGRENLERIARAMRLHIARPIDVEGQSLVVGSSIGIAVYPSDGQTAEQLVRNADAALYRAKRQGSGHAFFGDA